MKSLVFFLLFCKVINESHTPPGLKHLQVCVLFVNSALLGKFFGHKLNGVYLSWRGGAYRQLVLSWDTSFQKHSMEQK